MSTTEVTTTTGTTFSTKIRFETIDADEITEVGKSFLRTGIQDAVKLLTTDSNKTDVKFDTELNSRFSKRSARQAKIVAVLVAIVTPTDARAAPIVANNANLIKRTALQQYTVSVEGVFDKSVVTSSTSDDTDWATIIAIVAVSLLVVMLISLVLRYTACKKNDGVPNHYAVSESPRGGGTPTHIRNGLESPTRHDMAWPGDRGVAQYGPTTDDSFMNSPNVARLYGAREKMDSALDTAFKLITSPVYEPPQTPPPNFSSTSEGYSAIADPGTTGVSNSLLVNGVYSAVGANVSGEHSYLQVQTPQMSEIDPLSPRANAERSPAEGAAAGTTRFAERDCPQKVTF
jgi:hypothetical protein